MDGCKISVITGSRAEWGLLKPLAEKIQADPDIDLQLIVTGSHLSPQFGMTVNEIPADWISAKVECILASDSPVAISKAIGLAIISFGEVYERIKPDLVIVLGDRFEILASAVAAHISAIPLAHIHGGEVTEGVYDDAFRHSITKMSQLHFVAAEPYRDRVIQLGEHPDNVFCVGALGCDGLQKRDKYKITKRIVVIFHPTFDNEQLNDINEYIPKDLNYATVTSLPDVGDSLYIEHQWKSEPRDRFLEFCTRHDALIGNSSSGIIEAPALGVPTVNIGDRQKGRLMAHSIIQAEPTKESIQAAFDKLYSKEFQDLMNTDYYMPYKGENVAGKIVAIIRERVPNINMKKGFYDLSTYKKENQNGISV